MNSKLSITFGILVLMSLDYLRPNCHAEAGVISLTTQEDASNAGEFAITKCRQQCFIKTLDRFMFRHNINSPKSVETCRETPNCYMCFDYCRVLTVAVRDLAQSMCNDRVFCSKGCRTACDFYRIKSIDTLIYELVNNS